MGHRATELTVSESINNERMNNHRGDTHAR
jgi:hypothetical protein